MRRPLLVIALGACVAEAPVLDRADPATAAECAEGGTVIRSGADEDGDGVLDDGEVTATEVICREALLSRIAEAPITAECPGGGLAFHSGRDRNGDGALDDDEIERTERDCSDALARDLVIRSDAEMALLGRLRAIDGSLHVGAGVTRVALPALTRVRDEMWIRGEVIASIDLPALEQVGARRGDWDLVISGNAALTALSLGVASCDDTSIKILDNPALASLDLTCAGVGRLEVHGNRALAAARLDVGRGAGTVVVRDNHALAQLAVGGDSLSGLHVTERALSGLDLGAQLVIDSVAIAAPIGALPPLWGSPARVALTGTRLPAIDVGASEIVLVDNPELMAARVRGVSALTIEANPRLASVTLDTAEQAIAPTRIALVDNPALTTAPWLADLLVIEALSVRGSPQLALPKHWELLGASVSIELADVTSLRHLAVYAAELTGLEISATSLERLDVVAGRAGDSEAQRIALVANPVLAVAHVDVPLDAWSSSDIVVGANRVLADLRVHMPAQARRVRIVDNPALSSCLAASMLAATVAAVEEQHGNNEGVICRW